MENNNTFNPLWLFDTSQGPVIVEEMARRLMKKPEEKKQIVLDDLSAMAISFLESYRDDYEKVQLWSYTYAVDIYRTANYITIMNDDVTGYLKAVARPIFRWFKEYGLMVHLLISNDFIDLSRPVNVFPVLFEAAGLAYICVRLTAYELMKKDGHVSSDFPRLYGEYKERARAICDSRISELVGKGDSYIFVDINEDDTDNMTLSLSYAEKDGHLVAIKDSGPEVGKGGLIYSTVPGHFE